MPRRRPPLPNRLRRLDDLAHDLWWSWNPAARDLFRRLDPALWRATAHNPLRLLRMVPTARLERAAGDPEFRARYDETVAALEQARTAHATWWSAHAPARTATIAYCSAEFAVHQSLPIYAGGLGVLAGDHCKEASDLGIPLVGVGFLYPEGYFRQRISGDGSQQEAYPPLDRTDAPVVPASMPDGSPCVVEVPLGGRTVRAATWLVRLGRAALYLLDTDLPANAPPDRGLTARLYGGDRNIRIQQEIVLGLGGVRALRALGVTPAVWHLNEGHAGFVILQRLRDAVEAGRSFHQALADVRATTVFTTHTPVAAGHDAFPLDLVHRQLAGAWGPLEADRGAFLALGRDMDGGAERFNMTALALRAAGRTNGVSALHGQVTRRMWGAIWPGIPEADRPVGSITNGVHLPTWLAGALADLLERRLGPGWREHQDDRTYWDRLADVPDAELWAVRQALRRRLFSFLRTRARQRWVHDRATASRMMATGMLLDPDALTIGFARRFTAYKRPELIFRDEARLIQLLEHASRPVQLLFAGKAHPADETGQQLVRRIVARTQDARFAGRLAFIGDYDVHVARYLVQGCDVWLNTPRKPLEASGTSGMKASINGVPHLSIADGWWAEGYTGTNGWLIDGGAGADDPEAADAGDADALYDLLEREVVPRFYERDEAGVPRGWVAIVKEAIRTVAPRFSARRMVTEYASGAYAAAPFAAADDAPPSPRSPVAGTSD